MTTVLTGPDEVRAAVGTHLGHSDWLEVTQERIDLFASATGAPDMGLMMVSLTNLFLPQIVEVAGFAMGVNYGADTIRYPAPVPAGARVRGGAELVDVIDVKGGLQTLIRITVEIDGADEPACVVDSLSRWLH